MPPITRSRSKESTDASATKETVLSELYQEPGSRDKPLQQLQLRKRSVSRCPPTTRSRSMDGRAPKKARLSKSNTESGSEDISQLNDDCLLEIFSYLPLNDLCAISDCSRRFCGLADSTVRALWRDERNEITLAEFVNVLFDYNWPLARFAHCIRHLSVYQHFKPRKTDKHFTTMLRKCDSLITLQLFDWVNLSLISRRWIALQNIERLDLSFCNGNTLKHVQLAMACPKLKYLTMKMGKLNARILTPFNDHENIECIEILARAVRLDEFKTPLQLNKLKKLTVGYVPIRNQNRLIKALAKYGSLDELKLKVVRPDDVFFRNFNGLRNIKKCELHISNPISTAQMDLAAKFTFKMKARKHFYYRFAYHIKPKN